MTNEIIVNGKKYSINKEYHSWNDYMEERNKIKNDSNEGHFCLRCKNDTNILLQTFTPLIYNNPFKQVIEFINGDDMSHVFYVCEKCGYAISVVRNKKVR